VDVSKCQVFGRGIQPTGLRIGDSALIQVQTLGAGSGDLSISVVGPHGTEVPVSISQVSLFLLR
jgi:filamin